ncbi:hypothetical protein GW17_00056937 [Ensete ventricosum]|nr:hypothetical protein GW17_00056937 [Ensete ventricosum]
MRLRRPRVDREPSPLTGRPRDVTALVARGRLSSPRGEMKCLPVLVHGACHCRMWNLKRNRMCKRTVEELLELINGKDEGTVSNFFGLLDLDLYSL